MGSRQANREATIVVVVVFLGLVCTGIALQKQFFQITCVRRCNHSALVFLWHCLRSNLYMYEFEDTI